MWLKSQPKFPVKVAYYEVTSEKLDQFNIFEWNSVFIKFTFDGSPIDQIHYDLRSQKYTHDNLKFSIEEHLKASELKDTAASYKLNVLHAVRPTLTFQLPVPHRA